MKAILCAIALLTASVSAAGCAYTEDRLNDFTDILNAKIDVGEGVALSGRVPWAALGLGYSYSASIGFAYRGFGVWKGERTDIQFLLPYVHTEEVEPLAGSITRYGVGDRGLLESWPPGGENDVEYERLVAADSYESYLRLGLTAQLFIGADVELRPVEAVDFILGFFTVDFRKDDTAAEDG